MATSTTQSLGQSARHQTSLGQSRQSQITPWQLQRLRLMSADSSSMPPLQHPTTEDGGGHGVPGGVIALLLCLLVLGVAVLCIMLYLKRSGKLYKMIPFKPLVSPKRTSSMSSHRALDTEDQDTAETEQNQGDGRVPNTESTMFTIEDHDMDSIDIDRQSRGTNDEYFFDEVFVTSGFEDEVTNASMRQLYLASQQEEDEMLDVDAIVSSITSKSTKT